MCCQPWCEVAGFIRPDFAQRNFVERCNFNHRVFLLHAQANPESSCQQDSEGATTRQAFAIGIRRSVVRKIAAGIPAFVQMEHEGILETLSSQHRAAQQFHTLIAQAVATSA